MRLKNLDNVTSEPVPDVIKTMLHRSELFGQAFSRGVQRLLRGPSPWSVGERELFAGFVSKKNQCEF